MREARRCVDERLQKYAIWQHSDRIVIRVMPAGAEPTEGACHRFTHVKLTLSGDAIDSGQICFLVFPSDGISAAL